MTSHKHSFKIPISNIRERVEYVVYQGEKVIRTGDFRGNSFSNFGKNRLAGMLINNPPMSDAKLTTYRVYCDNQPGWLSSAATVVSFDRNNGTITAETDEFTSAGTYWELRGWSDNEPSPPNMGQSAYHYISTELTIGAGQTVKFFVEYQFSGLGSEIDWGGYTVQDSGNYPSVVGDIVCAAVLFNFAGDNPPFNHTIGAIERLTENCYGSTDYGEDAQHMPNPEEEALSHTVYGVNMARIDNNIIISGIQHSVDFTHGIWWIRVLTSRATNPKVFHEWSVSSDGDASGPFKVQIDGAQNDIKVQTDAQFTFG